MEAVIFYIFGAITLVSAFFVVALRRPIHNVLFMILTMISLAGLFVLLRAEFIAMVQLIVYAGAVMVLFLFVIMLLNLEESALPTGPGAVRWWIGIVVALALVALLVPVLGSVLPAADTATQKLLAADNTRTIGGSLFTTYLLPFEIASVLLLAAMIGAVIFAKKKY